MQIKIFLSSTHTIMKIKKNQILCFNFAATLHECVILADSKTIEIYVDYLCGTVVALVCKFHRSHHVFPGLFIGRLEIPK